MNDKHLKNLQIFYDSLIEISMNEGKSGNKLRAINFAQNYRNIFSKESIEGLIVNDLSLKFNFLFGDEEMLNLLVYETYDAANGRWYDILESNNLEYVGEIIQKTSAELNALGIPHPELVEKSFTNIDGRLVLGQDINYKRPTGKFETVEEALEIFANELDINSEKYYKIVGRIPSDKKVKIQGEHVSYSTPIKSLVEYPSSHYLKEKGLGFNSINETRVELKKLHPSLKFNFFRN